MTNRIMDVMTSFPLFESLSRVQLARLIPHLEMKQFSKGEVICHQNDKADALYLITEGTAQLVHNNEQGHSIVVGQLMHNTYYGASEILEQTTYMNSLIASEDTAIIEFSRSGLFRLLNYNPSLVINLLKNQQDIFEKCCNIFTRVHYQDTLSIEEVWKRLQNEEKEFICSTFLMDKITPEGCEDLLGAKDCKEIICRLVNYPHILVKIDSKNAWEYTELLKHFIIENKLVHEEEIHKQNIKIAEWAVRNKNWEFAVNHFLEINDFDQAVSCIEKLFENGWKNPEKLDLYIRQLPEKHYYTISAYLEKGKKAEAVAIPGENIIKRLGISLKTNFGWLLCLLLPVLTYFWANTQGFNWDQKLFLCILASAVIMWMFKLVADYIVSIFIIIACLTLKAVPSNIILEGFTSGAFFLAMSIFGLGAVLVSSGLIYRVSLMILYYFPSTLFWQNLALSLVGTFITPVVPSANGRLALVSPIVMDMTETMGFKPQSRAGVRLSMSALSGFGLMSNFFLTGKSINFVLLGLLSIDLQNRFSFLYWMIAAGMAGVVCFIGRFFVAAAFYKAETSPKISKNEIKNQLSIMGKFNFSEWIAVLSSFIFLLGVMTSTLHKIRTPWVGVMILFLVLFVGELGKEDFKKEIDWPFLLFLGGLIGFVKAFSYLHLDLWIGKQLTFLAVFMTQNFFVFIILLSIIILIVRLVLPANATVALLCAVLIPVAGMKGINPWIVGFCILLMSSGWFFPYQSTFYTTFLETTKGKMFTDKQTAPFHIWTNLINLLALLLSVPYWKALGLLK